MMLALGSGNATYLRASLRSGRSLKYSLDILFPYLADLERIVVDGSVPQGVVNAIVRMDAKKLKSIKLRTHAGTGWFMGPNYSDDSNLTELRLGSLGSIRSLEHLEVDQLSHMESLSLGRAIEPLIKLKYLRVSAYSAVNAIHRVAGAESPMAKFLAHLCSDSGEKAVCRLPSTLKKFLLVDGYSERIDTTIQPPTQDFKSSYPELRLLVTNIPNARMVANLLKWLSYPKLDKLTLCASRSFNSFERAIDSADPDAINDLNDIVMNYQDMAKVALVNAWDLHPFIADQLNEAWQGHFALTDLVLGTKERVFYKHHAIIPGTSLEHNALSCNLYGYNDPASSSRWGSSLERLRLEAVELQDLVLDCLSDASLANLRVLSISPVELVRSSFYIHTDPSQYTAGSLASKIAKQGISSLKIVHIGGCRFWMDTEADSVSFNTGNGDVCEFGTGKALNFKHAQFDQGIVGNIEAWVISEDLAFIDPKARLNTDIRRRPDQKQMREWNLPTLRNIRGVH